MPPVDASAEEDLADLKRKSVRGGMTTMSAQAVTVVIQLGSTVILARLFSPEDYGVIAMVMAVTAFAGLFRDLGLSAAAIQKKELTDAQQSNLFWLNVAMGTLLTGIVAAASPLVAWFYSRPELIAVTLVLSFNFLIGSCGTQHSARLMREMQFGRKAIAGIMGTLVSFGIAVTLAVNEFSYWALVWGNLSGGMVTTLLLWVLAPFQPGMPRRRTGLRRMLKFGAHITAFDLANYFHRNVDSILIGRFWGTEALGLYSRAYALLMFPINNLRGPINAVAFPAMSRLQGQPGAYRTYYRRLASLLALVSMPLAAFLFVAKDPVVRLVLGPRWTGVIPIFGILAAVAFVQPVVTLWGMVLLSRGMGRTYLRLGVLHTLCTVFGFAAGLPWGPTGVAVGYAVATYASAYPILRWAFRDTPLRLQDFFTSIGRPSCASLVGLCAAGLVMRTSDFPSAAAAVLCLALVFAPAYLLSLRLLPGGRQEFGLLWRLTKPVLLRLCFSRLGCGNPLL